MRRFFIMSLASAVLLWLSIGPAFADEERVFGKGVSSEDTIAISELLAHPENYLGETVRVQGPVVGLCKKRGCWMDLGSDQEFQKLTIKVKDGEIVFPVDCLGEWAIAEGEFTALPLKREQAIRYLRHEAECQGEAFDESTVPEDFVLYRIQGTGAVVREDPPEAETETETGAEAGAETEAEAGAETEASAETEAETEASAKAADE
jgi:hypothetical protein